jgi:hypothetical protein
VAQRVECLRLSGGQLGDLQRFAHRGPFRPPGYRIPANFI